MQIFQLSIASLSLSVDFGPQQLNYDARAAASLKGEGSNQERHRSIAPLMWTDVWRLPSMGRFHRVGVKWSSDLG